MNLDKEIAELLGWTYDPKPYVPEYDAYATASYFREGKPWIAAEDWAPSRKIEQAIELLEGTEEDWVLYAGYTCYLGRPKTSGWSFGGCCFECCGGCKDCYAVAGEGETPSEAICKAWISYKTNKEPKK